MAKIRARKVSVKKVRIRHTPKGTRPQSNRPGLGLPPNTKQVTNKAPLVKKVNKGPK